MYIPKTLQEESVHNNFLMGLIFWTNWGPADPNENPPMYMIFEKSF